MLLRMISFTYDLAIKKKIIIIMDKYNLLNDNKIKKKKNGKKTHFGSLQITCRMLSEELDSILYSTLLMIL